MACLWGPPKVSNDPWRGRWLRDLAPRRPVERDPRRSPAGHPDHTAAGRDSARVVGNLRRPPKTCHSSSESLENGDSEYVIRYAGKIRPFLKFQYLYNIRNYFFMAAFKASSQSANAKYLVRTCSQHAREQSCCSKYQRNPLATV